LSVPKIVFGSEGYLDGQVRVQTAETKESLMSKFLRAAAVLATFVMAASIGHAQVVAMAGEYSEGNGIIINIPQNPPGLPCATDQTDWDAQNNARCLRNVQQFFGGGAAPIFVNPHHGVVGARNLNAGAGGSAGLNVGDPFSIPPLAFQQRLGYQVGIVLNNVTVQLDTFFTARWSPVATSLG
jgi:hypothetical protein